MWRKDERYVLMISCSSVVFEKEKETEEATKDSINTDHLS